MPTPDPARRSPIRAPRSPPPFSMPPELRRPPVPPFNTAQRDRRSCIFGLTVR
ncbi:hypothetical protein [Amycolatopsis sp. NPDC052450]|uniref:hypothetical protein n=1 Tax=Amycolatopsis sp. NPDC052450 TaxID=3363937 RepID=UPI0037C88EC2